MKKFSYSPLASLGNLVQQIIGVIGILVSTGVAFFLFWETSRVELSTDPNLLNDPRSTLVCVGLWAIFVGWITSLGLINCFPTIWLDEMGVSISTFLFFKVHIPWSEVININIGGVRFGHDLVNAKRITLFHRIYGMMYSHTIHPSFIIRKDIKDHDILISEIRKHIQRFN